MYISNTSANELLTQLERANIIHLADNEGGYILTGESETLRIESEQYARISFEIPSSTFFDLYDNFKKEYTHNKHIIGFNPEFYCNATIKECLRIKQLFEDIVINGIEICTRKDVICKHYKIGEVEEGFDSDGNPFSFPKAMILSTIPYKDLKKCVIDKISSYFSYQKRTIDIIIKYLRNKLKQSHITRSYGTSYRYKYFKINESVWGEMEDQYKNIIDFFDELERKGYVATGSKKSLMDFFNDKPSASKVIWMKSKQELSYLISRLIKQQIIADPKRKKSELISKIFIQKDGTEFLPEHFHDLHDPKNTSELDILVGILR